MTKSNLIPFDQIKEPLHLPKQQIGSEQVPQPPPPPPPPTSGINRTRRILPVIQGTFAAIERAENYLPLQPFFNNIHFGQTLINCIHNQHRTGLAYLTSILWRPASTHTLKTDLSQKSL